MRRMYNIILSSILLWIDSFLVIVILLMGIDKKTKWGLFMGVFEKGFPILAEWLWSLRSDRWMRLKQSFVFQEAVLCLPTTCFLIIQTWTKVPLTIRNGHVRASEVPYTVRYSSKLLSINCLMSLHKSTQQFFQKSLRQCSKLAKLPSITPRSRLKVNVPCCFSSLNLLCSSLGIMGSIRSCHLTSHKPGVYVGSLNETSSLQWWGYWWLHPLKPSERSQVPLLRDPETQII